MSVVGAGACSNHDAQYPAMKVVVLPINTHQVQAIGVKTRTYMITAKPATTPKEAAFWPTRRVSSPSVTEAIERPDSSTDPQWRATIPMATRTMAQATVANRAQRRTRLSSTCAPERERGRKKSITVVDASEFNAALRLAMAAATMAAVTRPAIPGGRRSQT